MAQYLYAAIDAATGKDERGEIAAADRSEAIAQLKQRGLAPTQIEPAKISSPPSVPPRQASVAALRRQPLGSRFGRFRSVPRKSVMHATRQLATLVNAGMPLARGLAVLQRQERNLRFGVVLGELGEVISGGGALSDGLRRHGRIFDPLYVNMVRAGEARGGLGAGLDRLALFMEKSERLKAKVKSAMVYPLVITVVATAIVGVLMVVVVPKFETIFGGLLKGQPLPTLTRGLLLVSSVVQHHALAIAGCAALSWFVFAAVRKTSRGGTLADWLTLKLPVLGDLALKACVARVARTFGSLLANGVPILEALVITQATAGNAQVSRALGEVHEAVKRGEGVARSLEATALFPGMVTGMVQVGEETGALPAMLGKIADIYDEEVDNAVAALTSIIEPIMIVVMALIVGTIVIALFLPIVSVIQHLQ